MIGREKGQKWPLKASNQKSLFQQPHLKSWLLLNKFSIACLIVLLVSKVSCNKIVSLLSTLNLTFKSFMATLKITSIPIKVYYFSRHPWHVLFCHPWRREVNNLHSSLSTPWGKSHFFLLTSNLSIFAKFKYRFDANWSILYYFNLACSISQFTQCRFPFKTLVQHWKQVLNESYWHLLSTLLLSCKLSTKIFLVLCWL